MKLLLRGGAIRDLELQVKYPLKVNGVLITSYVADFRYCEPDHGEWATVVEDVKGYRTREYQIKKKLLLALTGVAIREV